MQGICITEPNVWILGLVMKLGVLKKWIPAPASLFLSALSWRHLCCRGIFILTHVLSEHHSIIRGCLETLPRGLWGQNDLHFCFFHCADVCSASTKARVGEAADVFARIKAVPPAAPGHTVFLIHMRWQKTTTTKRSSFKNGLGGAAKLFILLNLNSWPHIFSLHSVWWHETTKKSFCYIQKYKKTPKHLCSWVVSWISSFSQEHHFYLIDAGYSDYPDMDFRQTCLSMPRDPFIGDSSLRDNVFFTENDISC